MRILLIAFLLAPQAFGAFSFVRQITLGAATTSTQTNFPVLIQLDASNVGTTLKVAGSGGHIQHTVTQSGGPAVTEPADAVFATDSVCASKIAWETESYDGVAGVWKFWLVAASLTTGTNTVFLCYGDAGVTTQQNTGSFAPSAVWDANFNLVTHMTASATPVDSTTNARTLTVSGPTSTASGEVNGGYTWAADQTSQITVPSAAVTLNLGTYEIWVKPVLVSGSATHSSFLFDTDGSRNMVTLNSSSIPVLIYNDARQTTFASTSWTANTWHYIAVVYNKTGNVQQLYFDGVLQTGATPTGTWGSTAIGTSLHIGNRFASSGANTSLDGTADEVRVSSTNRAASWIATTNANISAPLTFNTVGSEVAFSGGGGAAPVRHRVIAQ
jgi:hypothetical protein